MITYKTGLENMDWEQLVELYYELDLVIGLGRKRNIDRIKTAFHNSYKVVTAWDSSKLVGAGRMISDGYCYGWIHDVGVLKEYQKQDIGKGVMNELMNEKEPILFGLTSSFEAVGFYTKLGLKKHKTAMAKYPGKSTYLEE